MIVNSTVLVVSATPLFMFALENLKPMRIAKGPLRSKRIRSHNRPSDSDKGQC